MIKAATSIRRAADALRARGMIGLALIVLSTLGYILWVEPARSDIARLEAKVARMQKAAGMPGGESRSNAPLADFYAFFPTAKILPRALNRLFALAEARGLRLQKGEYRLVSTSNPHIETYQVSFPLSASYTQIREFASAALRELPYAALDEFRIEKRRVEDPTVDAHLKFTLFLRIQ